MTSPVNWALLGLVIERPGYGNELFHRFQREYEDVLSISSESHIYSALNALEGRGLIAEIPGTRSGRQPRPQYQATQSGLEGYIGWLVGQADAERKRQELWVRQLAVFAHNPSMALEVLARFQRQYLKGVGQVGRRPATTAISARNELIDWLVAEHQRIAAGGTIEWLRSAQDGFEARAKGAARDGSARP